MRLGIVADHGGFRLKEKIKENFDNIDWVDFGTDSKESVDYPDFAYKLSAAISENEVDQGIALCGSGIGIAIALNRNPDVRAAQCTSEKMAELSRTHNDANVLVLGERIMDEKTALACVKKFLGTDFDGGERHARRVNKLSKGE